MNEGTNWLNFVLKTISQKKGVKKLELDFPNLECKNQTYYMLSSPNSKYIKNFEVSNSLKFHSGHRLIKKKILISKRGSNYVGEINASMKTQDALESTEPKVCNNFITK